MQGKGSKRLPDPPPGLLLRLGLPGDEPAWREFMSLYGPPLHAYGRRQGLQDADAVDLTQEILQAVSRSLRTGAYDASKGAFGAWLWAVARHKLHDLRARQRRQCQGSGDSGVLHLLEQQPAPQGGGQEWRRSQWEALLRAAAQVREALAPATWQAFWHTAVLGQRGKEVARLLGMSVAAVYLAKGRVLARLKAQLRSAQQGKPGGGFAPLCTGNEKTILLLGCASAGQLAAKDQGSEGPGGCR